MSIDMTDQFVNLDIKTDDWQTQVIDAFEAADQGADVSAEDASQANWTQEQANANGCVQTSEGKNVKVDGSAFLYVNERVNTQLTNQASGLSTAAKLPEKLSSMIQRKFG